MQRIVLIIMLALVAGLAGCTANQRSDSLSETLTAYASTLRWNGFQQAQGFVAPDYREAHPLSDLQIRRYQQVQVAGYDEGRGPVPAGDNEVHQVVRIVLVNRNTQRERTVIDRQVWRWDADAARWWLTTGLPDITHANAGAR